jgi:hypothetical protein
LLALSGMAGADTSIKRFFGPQMLTMRDYGPARGRAGGVSETTT